VAETATGLWAARWRIRNRLDSLTLFWKVVIGNSLIMASGAVVGTWVTKTMLEQSNFTVATMLVMLGISFSMVVNYAIMRAAFKPLNAIQRTVDEVSHGNTRARVPKTERTDPDIDRLASTMNMMLARLEQDATTIAHHRRQIQVMSGQVLTAQEEERRRIARELHDETSQALNALLLSLEMAAETVPDPANPARQRLDASKQLATQTLDGIHKLAFDLRPTILDDLGLVASVRWYAKRQAQTYGFSIDVCVDGAEDRRLASQTEVALFRVIQEGLTNVAKHACAKLARVTLALGAGEVRVTVEDDGAGFDPAQVNSDRLGLFGIHERAALLGGSFHVDSTRGSGTRLTVVVPALPGGES